MRKIAFNKYKNLYGGYLSNKKLISDGIHIVGAREHNLKNISVFIPRNKMTVITGLSGSGKSSLAFDTIYAEGQRRYLESLSVYARYFIDQLEKPDVEDIIGLSPAICIDQKTISHNPRSTVGTVTEMYDYLRLLYTKVGKVFCPEHQIPLQGRNQEGIINEIMGLPPEQTLLFLSPIVRGKKGEFQKELRQLLSLGYDKARIDGEWKDLHRVYRLVKKETHHIDLLVDRLPIEKKHAGRIREAVEKALSMSGGYLKMANPNVQGDEKMYSLHYSCPYCGYASVEPEPGLFSFNSSKGACPHCNGTGLNYYEEDMEEFLEICPVCNGDRLRAEALQVKIKGLNISQAGSLSVHKLAEFLKSLKFQKSKKLIADKIIEPVLLHIDFLKALGSDYLSFNRSISTLSGGEAQRIRLVSQLSSPLIGVLYILDEPSIGLHPRDHGKILSILKKIRDRGNTIIMVEHDEESIRQADKVIDLGPGAGTHGGTVIAEGTVSQIEKNKNSLTGAYLSRKESIPVLPSLYNAKKPVLVLKGARQHNLKNIDVSIPLGCLVGVSGVSGSGKSTLIRDTFYPALLNYLNGEREKPVGVYSDIKGLEFIEKAIQIDQKPIGRTPRSVPATYTGIFQMIRVLFSHLPGSKMKGYKLGYFSFNVTGGRCEKCLGGGYIKMEMGFLPNVFVLCDECQGKRYREDILNIKYKDKNIFQILDMTVSQALEFFKNHSYIFQRLSFLQEVGLGYVKLGQSSTTLSGGEAQRIKLSRELAKNARGHILYILDEPTTGLHFHDIKKLVELLRKLVRKDRTVVVIEHNLDVLKSCDYLIDLGPEGGEAGGYVVATGKPEEVAKHSKSHTGKYLKSFF